MPLDKRPIGRGGWAGYQTPKERIALFILKAKVESACGAMNNELTNKGGYLEMVMADGTAFTSRIAQS
jgi:hypothetical protein